MVDRAPPSPRRFPLEVEALCLDKADRTILEDVDARFGSGAVTAIVGPSGAGKTSLLRCMNRLEDPTRGRVVLDGEDIRTIEPVDLRRRVGMIFQTPIILEGGVRANLTYGMNGVSDDSLAHALDLAGLDVDFLTRESSALSVGQAQRVCIARALVREPEVLLMDEPTSALDKDASTRIESLIKSLREQGLAVVLVTHNLEQARRVADEAVVLVDGRVEGVGKPDEIEAAWPEQDEAR